MNAPPFEAADIVRLTGKSFIENNRLPWQHLRVPRAVPYVRVVFTLPHELPLTLANKRVLYALLLHANCGNTVRDRSRS